MKRTLISELKNHIGNEVKIQGWIQVLRDQKTMQFLVIRDHTGLVQVAHERKLNPDLANRLSAITVESAVSVMGLVIKNEKVKLGQIEIGLKDLVVENLSDRVLPISNDSSLDIRLDWRFLDLRLPRNLLIFQIQTTIEQAMRSYWQTNGFIEIHSPKLMGAPSESGAELFKLEYFGRYAYLAQSPQFYKQMAMSAGFDRVFEIGPVFRANPSFTSRHDTEFTSVDVELSWIDSCEEVMSFEEHWLQNILTIVAEKHGDEITKTFGVDIIPPQIPFPRISMLDAHQIVKQTGYILPVEGKGDLDPEAERILARYVQSKFGHEFVYVIDYPSSVRPFYHMRYDDRPDVTKSFDLIWKGLEITTGAQREHRYEILVRQALEKGLSLDPIKYYLEFFKYGCPPHGGFGFGLTRMLMVMLGIKNVREVTYLYRGPNRLDP